MIKGISVRSDGLLGPQEFSRWPQFHTKSTLHHSTIPFRFRNSSSIEGDEVLWYAPTEADVEVVGGGVDSLGQPVGLFKKRYLDALTRAFELSLVNARKSYSKTGETELNRLLVELERRGRGAMDRMRTVATGWFFNLTTFREVQRAALELIGINNLSNIVLPRLQSLLPAPYLLLKVRGAFSRDPAVVLTFFSIGIPIWYIRPPSSITRETKIFEVAHRMVDWTESDYLCDAPFLINKDEKRPVLGTFDVKDDLRSISDNVWTDDGMRQLVAIIKAEEKIFLGQPSTHPISALFSSNSSSRDAHQTARTPARVPSSHTSSPARSRPMASKKALLRKQERARAHHELNRPRSQYLFIPDSPIDCQPDAPLHDHIFRQMLLSLGEIEKDSNTPVFYAMPPGFLLVHPDIDKTVKLYHNYLNIRPALLRILIRGGTFTPIFRRLGEWSSVLVGNYSKTEPVSLEYASESVARLYDTLEDRPSTSLDPRPENEVCPSKKAKRAALAAMKVTFASEYALPSYDPALRPLWRGQHISPDMIRHDKCLRQEIQWELNEISFRVEFCALDGMMLAQTVPKSKDERSLHWSLLRQIFRCPTRGEFSLFPDTNSFVEEYWGDSLEPKSVQALRDVMKEWKLPSMIDLPSVLPSEKEQLREALRTLVELYIQTFVKYFSRIPSLPLPVPPSLKQ